MTPTLLLLAIAALGPSPLAATAGGLAHAPRVPHAVKSPRALEAAHGGQPDRATDPVGGSAFAAMVRIPAGRFTPLFGSTDGEVAVSAFRLDRHPVTVAEFAAFVEAYPAWRRGKVKRVFADEGYLRGWHEDLDPGFAGPDDARRPVTDVSWFAARAYCEARGARLPTLDEWEFAAAASEDRPDAFRDAEFNQRLLELYTRPRPQAPVVGTTFENWYGVHDLHGVVWEWVEDFTSVLLSGAGREDAAGTDRKLFCAAGSVGATDTGNYAAFLRYAFRAKLRGAYTGARMGFRCAADA